MTASTTPKIESSAAELAALDRRHLIHPQQSGTHRKRRIIVRGEGSTLWDASGKELLDMCGGGNWVAQVGHGRPELVETAARQTAELSYFSCFHEFSNNQAIQLAARLAALAPADLNQVHFTSSGSEGVDTAIKLARLYHHHRGNPDRTWIVARRFGYHGTTLGSGSVTGLPPMQEAVGPTLPHIEKVTPPWPYRRELFDDQDPTDFLLRELEETIDRIGPGQIAAMIGEPVMGAGGVIVPPPDYWPRVRELLDKHGILLIADEVITAYGRTGAWFESTRQGMRPDIIVTAKGLTSGYAPLGAVLIRDEIGETVAGGEALFFHGHTYSGHPVACAVALKNLELLGSEQLLQKSQQIGDWLREDLAAATELPVVGEIRGVGAMLGIELVADRHTREPIPAGPVPSEMVHALYDRHGVVMRNYGATLVMGPPLVLTRQQAAHAAGAVLEVLSRLRPDGRLRTA